MACVAELQVIGGGGTEVAACVALRPGRRGWSRPVYLFQAPDGIGRLALEHRLLRPADGYIAAVFATSLAPQRIGGLAAVILRSSMDGGEQTTVVGPPGTCRSLHALRHFVRWRHPRVCGVDAQAEAIVGNGPLYEDAHVRVWALTTEGTAGLERQHNNCKDDSGGSVPQAKRPKVEAPARHARVCAANLASTRITTSGHGTTTTTAVCEVLTGADEAFKSSALHSDTNPLFCRTATSGKLLAMPDAHAGPATGERLLAVVCECVQSDLTVVMLECATESDLCLLHPLTAALLDPVRHPRVVVLHCSATILQSMPQYQRWMLQVKAPHIAHLDLTAAARPSPLSIGQASPICPMHPAGYFAHRATARQRWRLNRACPSFYPVCPCFEHLGHELRAILSGDGGVMQLDGNGVAAPPLLAVVTAGTAEDGATPRFAISLGDTTALIEDLGTGLDVPAIDAARADNETGVRADLGKGKEAGKNQAEGARRVDRRKLLGNHRADKADVGEEVEAGQQHEEELAGAAPSNTAAGAEEPAWCITMIGTGCAEPSKHRASSGIHLQLRGGSGGGGILLEAGDGVVPQMMQLFGLARALALIGGLQCVWVSHKHADHCAGLLHVLTLHRRHRPATAPPLLLIGPNAVGFWVMEALQAAGSLPGDVCTFVHFGVFDSPAAPPIVAARRQELFQSCGLTQFQSVPVLHCADACAVVIAGAGAGDLGQVQPPADNATAGASAGDLGQVQPPTDNATAGNGGDSSYRSGGCIGGDSGNYRSSSGSGSGGWKIVYSGDTRPSDELAEAATGATLFIHEGTFDERQQAKAESKRHSTIPEALSVAEDARAWRVLLTHFSQRYPNVPPHDRSQFSGPRSAVAFDGLTISSLNVDVMPEMMPAVIAATTNPRGTRVDTRAPPSCLGVGGSRGNDRCAKASSSAEVKAPASSDGEQEEEEEESSSSESSEESASESSAEETGIQQIPAAGTNVSTPVSTDTGETTAVRVGEQNGGVGHAAASASAGVCFPAPPTSLQKLLAGVRWPAVGKGCVSVAAQASHVFFDDE